MRLSGQFVSGEMISFAVSGGGGSMSVGREIMKFCDSIVSALWQCVPLPMVGPKAVGCGFRLLIPCQLQD
jgi:hypothetical protein